jgi:hypothetical protein
MTMKKRANNVLELKISKSILFVFNLDAGQFSFEQVPSSLLKWFSRRRAIPSPCIYLEYTEQFKIPTLFLCWQ